MKPIIKKILIGTVDILLAVYLVLAVTAFNKPKDMHYTCNTLEIDVVDENSCGFINAKEVEKRLKGANLHPLNKEMAQIDIRAIEESLMQTPFIRSVDCYKTIGGKVVVSIEQRTPIIRVMSQNGDDYFLDDHDAIMPNTNHTSDLIVATGAISRKMATRQISPLGRHIMQNHLWRSLIEQVNVLGDGTIEIVPRVGDHIVALGILPDAPSSKERERLIAQFIDKKLTRLMKFYHYGLSEAGWNRYEYIDVQFDNQIICRHNRNFKKQLTLHTSQTQN